MDLWIPPRPDQGATAAWLRQLPVLPPPPPLRRPGGRARRVTAVVAIVVAVALVLSSVVGGPARTPTPEARSGPRYTFIETIAGEPVRWNPCEPIHYVVNDALANYADPLADTQEAVQRVSDATGIEFVYDGETDEEVVPGRSVYQPARYGDEWAPVLIAWTDPHDSPIRFERGDDVALGVASPLAPTHGRFDIFVSGWVALNADYRGPGGFDTPSAVGLTIQHELGHVMGMGHTKEYGELMQGSGGGAVDWGEGDLEGLAQLGREAGCLTTPDAAQH
ncbi:MAG: hypothetical protein ABJC60_03670 [Actinomycetota bacterium]